MRNDQLYKTYIEHLICLVGKLKHGEDLQIIADELERIIDGLNQALQQDVANSYDLLENVTIGGNCSQSLGKLD